MCLELRNITPKSLAAKADIPNAIIDALLQGATATGLNEHEDVDAIVSVIGLERRILFLDLGNEREAKLREAFRHAKIDLSEEENEAPPEDAPSEPEASDELDAGDADFSADAEESSADDVPADDVPASDDLHLEEPVWASEDVIQLGDTTFDITTKEFRAMFIGHVRALKKELGKTFQQIVDESEEMIPTTGWFSGVERGNSRVYRKQIEALAQSLDTTIGILLTGHGLNPQDMRAVGGKKSSGETLSYGTLPDDQRNEYFRQRVLRKGVELAEGVDAGELLALMGEDIESIDWMDVWMTKTVEGVKVSQKIETFADQLPKWNPAIRDLAVKRILKVMEDAE